MARLVADAGGDFLWKEEKGPKSLGLQFEAVLHRAGRADVWINTGTWKTREQAEREEPRVRHFQAWQRGTMFNNDARTNPQGALDFWESGQTRPDELLTDLIRILHPDLLPNHNLKWYRQLPASTEPSK